MVYNNYTVILDIVRTISFPSSASLRCSILFASFIHVDLVELLFTHLENFNS